MDLNQEVVNVESLLDYIGEDTIELSSGQSLKIESSPGGEELLDVECPAGKKWVAQIYIKIHETDA